MRSMQTNTCSATRAQQLRTGSLILEVMVGMMLLGLLLSVTAPVLKSVNESRRLSDQRRIAVLELSNLMEQVALWPSERLKDEELQQLTLSSVGANALAEAKLVSQAVKNSDPPGLVKVELTLDWAHPGALKPDPVRLTAWFAGQP